MAVRKVERELEDLGRLRTLSPQDALAGLRKALKDPVNLMVAKAAAIAAEKQLHELLPDLLRAFDRLFSDAVRRDPKCWGKNAIAKALTALEFREAAPYLRGMKHIQMEPGWGPPVDTADILRGVCVLGLASCAGIGREQALSALVDAAGDPSEPVRVEVVRAMAQLGEPLLLRLIARKGDPAPAVMGQVFDCLLALEGEDTLPFVASFFTCGAQEIREEAVLSIGSSRLPAAVGRLKEVLENEDLADLREVTLRALSLTRHEEAIEFLLDLIRNGRTADAKAAWKALSLNEELRAQAAEVAEKRLGPQMTADGRG